ncbi:aromatic amino acid lyase [Clostridium sp.]|uniref:aromatic amino acid lyase n=1 Tax=Clostridium sp. TaxID=1506 RepID=UPI001A4DC8D4|nr:aromatic amino acid lyase [Clostridium sp.]MBK5235221.1 aromatic amino acid lyase [Clostridium sp.]
MHIGNYFIDGYHLTINESISILRGELGDVCITKESISRCEASRDQIKRWLKKDAPVIYGVNTGLGNLKDTVLSPEDHLKWNKTIPYPHAVGMGEPINADITRLALLIRANVLSRAYSAVRPELIQRMLDIFNAGISPVVLELGSTGLSDLGPLAQSAMVVAGLEEAEVFYKGIRSKAQTCFTEVGLAPTFQLECKEVLSQMNGSTMTQAIAVLTYYSIEKLFDIQNEIEGFTINNEKYYIDAKEKVNCAISDSLTFISNIINFENNITCDNPLLFKIEGGNYEPVMGCNCSNTQVGYVLDLINILIADKSNLTYESICIIENDYPEIEGLRKLSLSLLMEIKSQCMPASADSISTKGNQEDHVEFSYGAARKAMKATKLFKKLFACQLYSILLALPNEKSVKLTGILKDVAMHLRLMDEECMILERVEVIEKFLGGYAFLN